MQRATRGQSVVALKASLILQLQFPQPGTTSHAAQSPVCMQMTTAATEDELVLTKVIPNLRKSLIKGLTKAVH